MTISPERERQLLASVEYPPAALRAIQFLLGRVRELEAQAELAESFVEICEVCGCEDGCECPARVRELEQHQAALTAALEKIARGMHGKTFRPLDGAEAFEIARDALEGGRNAASHERLAGPT